jgi:uncharacterized protein DUF3943
MRRAILVVIAALAVAAPARPARAQDSTALATPGLRTPPPAETLLALRPRKHPFRALLLGTAINVFVNRLDTWGFNSYAPLDGYWSRVGFKSWSENLRTGFVWDTDDFMTNVFLHPYNGAAYFVVGRDNGLDFWESAPLTFVGSLEWEYFGETTKPSLNDLYNTTFGGVVMGEMTHRVLDVVRDNRARGLERVVRELAALPLDPPGALLRLLSGDAARVHANPADRDPAQLGVRIQAGGQLGADSGGPGRRAFSGSMLFDMSYGDAFAKPYAQPFDVFEARLRAGTSAQVVTEMRVEGRLYGHELTDPTADMRWIFTVAQKMEYDANPAYRYGAQSLDLGFTSGFALGNGLAVQTKLFAEGIVLGAVDAPEGDTTLRARTYDFGPGLGFELAATLQVRRYRVLTARWHWAYLHSVSGSPADHYIQFPSIEATVPLTPALGLGAYAGWYLRRSAYARFPGETTAFPEYRAYLVWQVRPGPGPEVPR